MDDFELAYNEFIFQHDELKELNESKNSYTFFNTSLEVNVDNLKNQLNEGIFRKPILSHKGFLEMEYFIFNNLINKVHDKDSLLKFRMDLYSSFLVLKKYKIKLNFFKLFADEKDKLLVTLVCFKDGEEIKILPMDLSRAIFLTDLYKNIQIKDNTWYI